MELQAKKHAGIPVSYMVELEMVKSSMLECTAKKVGQKRQRLVITNARKIATFLDPRYKSLKMAASHEERFEVRELVAKVCLCLVQQNEEFHSMASRRQLTCSVDEFMYFGESAAANSNNPITVACKEVESYLDFNIDLMTTKPNQQDFLRSFRQNEGRQFPNLCFSTRKYLSIPDTSTPCERIFSKAGHSRRSMLWPKKIFALIFLQHNL